MILNQKMFGRAVFRAIFFIPVIVSTGIIAQIDLSTSELTNGMQNGVETGNQATGGSSASQLISESDITGLFSTMMVGSTMVTYVVQIINNIYNIVNRSGVQMLIFLAGLQSISPAIYESCSIDGATSWETFWKITFPMLSPTILLCLIYTIIDQFNSSTNQVIELVEQNMREQIHYACAQTWMYSLVVFAFVFVVYRLVAKRVIYLD